MEEPQPASQSDGTQNLRDYTLAKQEVTAIVRGTWQLFDTRGDKGREADYQALLVKLAEDRFNLAVVGQFKRGKSSLMNAVVGRDLLPTGLLPLTSAITTLCYGPHERVVLRREGWTVQPEISLGELADYITERGNPGNEKRLIEARVELPVPFLRRGLNFIDTPGVGSTREENTTTTYEFLPQADAVIFVTSVDAPLSETEDVLLRVVREHVRKLFVVVNKIDLLRDDERSALLDYIRTGIARALGTADLRLYPVSARLGLAAKLTHDRLRLHESGLAEFEEALTTFLVHEQGRAFLASVLDGALRLLPEAGEHHERDEASNSGAEPLALEIERLYTRMTSLRSTLLAGTPLADLRVAEMPVPADEQIIEHVIETGRTKRPQGAASGGRADGACLVCEAQGQAIFAFFSQWQYTLATSEAAQRAFAGVRGFCTLHTWDFQKIASPQGMSTGYAPLVEFVVGELRRWLEQPLDHPEAHVAALLPTTDTCPACRVLRETEAQQIQRFLAQLAAMEKQDLNTAREWLCLPHLQAALAIEPSAATAAVLVREQARRLEEIAEDMHAYTLKRDALRRGLLNAYEDNAWRRALAQLAGERLANAR